MVVAALLQVQVRALRQVLMNLLCYLAILPVTQQQAVVWVVTLAQMHTSSSRRNVISNKC